MLGQSTTDQPLETNELYTLLALLHYVRKELASVDEFAEYFVDMSIYQLSQRIPQSRSNLRAGGAPDSERE
jgi:hypothetical protein